MEGKVRGKRQLMLGQGWAGSNGRIPQRLGQRVEVGTSRSCTHSLVRREGSHLWFWKSWSPMVSRIGEYEGSRNSSLGCLLAPRNPVFGHELSLLSSGCPRP